MPIVILIMAKTADSLFVTGNINMALFGIDDALLIMGGSALAGGALNLFGGDAEKDKWARYQRELANQRLRIAKQYDEKLVDIKRQASFMKKQRSVAAQQKAAEYGVNPQSIAYSAVEDIDNSLMNAEAMLEEQKSKAMLEIDQMIEKANLMAPEFQTDIERFLEGALTGAGVGSQFANTLGGFNPTTIEPTVDLTTKGGNMTKDDLTSLADKVKKTGDKNTPYKQSDVVTDAMKTYNMPTDKSGFTDAVSTSPEQPGAQGMKGAFDFGLGDAKNLNIFAGLTDQNTTELLANAEAGLGPEVKADKKNNGFSFDKYFSTSNPDYYKYKNLYKFGLGKNFKF